MRNAEDVSRDERAVVLPRFLDVMKFKVTEKPYTLSYGDLTQTFASKEELYDFVDHSAISSFHFDNKLQEYLRNALGEYAARLQQPFPFPPPLSTPPSLPPVAIRQVDATIFNPDSPSHMYGMPTSN